MIVGPGRPQTPLFLDGVHFLVCLSQQPIAEGGPACFLVTGAGVTEDYKLVPTYSCDEIAFPDSGFKGLGHLDKKTITGVVSMLIVNSLEAVEVNKRQMQGIVGYPCQVRRVSSKNTVPWIGAAARSGHAQAA